MVLCEVEGASGGFPRRLPHVKTMAARGLYLAFRLLTLCGTGQACMQLGGFYDLINTTAGSSVPLPTTYTVHRERWDGFNPSFKWQHNGALILFFSGENCSLAAEGYFQNCTGKPYLLEGRDRDISFFPENASVILHNVQTRDSGLYKLESRYSNDTVLMTLFVAANGTPGMDGYKDQAYYINFILMTVLVPAAKVIFTALFLYFTTHLVK